MQHKPVVRTWLVAFICSRSALCCGMGGVNWMLEPSVSSYFFSRDSATHFFTSMSNWLRLFAYLAPPEGGVVAVSKDTGMGWGRGQGWVT